MRVRTALYTLVGVAALSAVAAAGWLTRDTWRGWLAPAPSPETAEKKDGHAHGHGHSHGDEQSVLLSPQAQANLRLMVKPVNPQTYWQVIRVPATVVERRRKSDRGGIGGVIAVPGDTVPPGG